MKIYNKDKTKEITTYDLKLGYLEPDNLIIHHDMVPFKPAVIHEEFVRQTGQSKIFKEIIDVPAVDEVPEYDEYEPIMVFIEYTQYELNQNRIKELKDNLNQTDYQAIKFAEGRMTSEEYAPIGEQRQAWRNEINKLEQEIEQ